MEKDNSSQWRYRFRRCNLLPSIKIGLLPDLMKYTDSIAVVHHVLWVNLYYFALLPFSRQNCRRAERPRRHAIDHQLHINLVNWKAEQVNVIKSRLKLACDKAGIVCTEAKRDQCSGIAQDRVPDIGFKLVEVLMRPEAAQGTIQ